MIMNRMPSLLTAVLVAGTMENHARTANSGYQSKAARHARTLNTPKREEEDVPEGIRAFQERIETLG